MSRAATSPHRGAGADGTPARFRKGCAIDDTAASVFYMTTAQRWTPRKFVGDGEKRLLAPHEVAYILEVPTRTVRNMLRRGELRDAGPDRRRRIDPQHLAERLSNRPLAIVALDAIVAGRLRVPRLGLDTQPLSLIERWEDLW